MIVSNRLTNEFICKDNKEFMTKRESNETGSELDYKPKEKHPRCLKHKIH